MLGQLDRCPDLVLVLICDLTRFSIRIGSIHREAGGDFSDCATHFGPCVVSAVAIALAYFHEEGSEPIHIAAEPLLHYIQFLFPAQIRIFCCLPGEVAVDTVDLGQTLWVDQQSVHLVQEVISSCALYGPQVAQLFARLEYFFADNPCTGCCFAQAFEVANRIA